MLYFWYLPCISEGSSWWTLSWHAEWLDGKNFSMSSTGYSYQLLNINFFGNSGAQFIQLLRATTYALPAMTENDYCSPLSTGQSCWHCEFDWSPTQAFLKFQYDDHLLFASCDVMVTFSFGSANQGIQRSILQLRPRMTNVQSRWFPGKGEKALHHCWRSFPINTAGLLYLRSDCRWRLSSILRYNGPIPTIICSKIMTG